MKVALVEMGLGNVRSIYKCLDSLGSKPTLASRPEEVLAADKLILPGVGHFASAIVKLKQLELFEALNEAVLVRKKAVLGICLGMQLMARRSEEGETNGFGWIDVDVVRFRVEDSFRHKVPHNGWNTIEAVGPSSLLKQVDASSEYYFSHSFHMQGEGKPSFSAYTEYACRFPSVLETDNIFGTQFHPEKSREAGFAIIKNFLGQ